MPPQTRKLTITGKRSLTVVIPVAIVKILKLKVKQKLYFRLVEGKIIVTTKP